MNSYPSDRKCSGNTSLRTNDRSTTVANSSDCRAREVAVAKPRRGRIRPADSNRLSSNMSTPRNHRHPRASFCSREISLSAGNYRVTSGVTRLVTPRPNK